MRNVAQHPFPIFFRSLQSPSQLIKVSSEMTDLIFRCRLYGFRVRATHELPIRLCQPLETPASQITTAMTTTLTAINFHVRWFFQVKKYLTGNKPIPHSPNRFKKLRDFTRCFDFLPQLADMDINTVVDHRLLFVRIKLLKDLFPR